MWNRDVIYRNRILTEKRRSFKDFITRSFKGSLVIFNLCNHDRFFVCKEYHSVQCVLRVPTRSIEIQTSTRKVRGSRGGRDAESAVEMQRNKIARVGRAIHDAGEWTPPSASPTRSSASRKPSDVTRTLVTPCRCLWRDAVPLRFCGNWRKPVDTCQGICTSNKFISAAKSSLIH